MKGRNTSSRGPQMKTKKYVKNKLMIGDSRPNIMSKPDSRSTQMRLTAGTAAAANHLIDQTAKGTKRIKMQDGGSFKKEVRARSPQAAKVYGNTKKAMKASYEKTTNKPVVAKAKPKPKPGGLTSRTKAKLGTASNPIIGAPGRARNKGLI